MEKIKRELNFIKYKSTKGELESAISSFKSENKQLFEDKEAEDKLRSAMEFLSKDIPNEERVRIASTIAFGTVGNPTSEAFKDLAKASPTSNPAPEAKKEESRIASKQEKLKEFFESI